MLDMHAKGFDEEKVAAALNLSRVEVTRFRIMLGRVRDRRQAAEKQRAGEEDGDDTRAKSRAKKLLDRVG